MTKGFWICALILPILLWYSFFFVLQENYRIQQLYLENTVYEYSQLVAKKGIFHKETFNEMYRKLRTSGEFDLYLTATRQDLVGAVAESGYLILERDLRQEGYDSFKITVIYKRQHPLTALLSQSFFYGQGSVRGEINLAASSCCMIQ